MCARERNGGHRIPQAEDQVDGRVIVDFTSLDSRRARRAAAPSSDAGGAGGLSPTASG
jgi:hypothetical protein